MKSVPSNSRQVGQTIQVWDGASGIVNPLPKSIGKIVKITKKLITVQYTLGTEYRFHRATGYIVGFAWPQYADLIAPETSS